MSQDANDFLMSGGVPAAKFPSIGTTVRGTIVSSEVTQQTDFTTGKPKFFENGDAMMQAVITLQTADRDPDITDDDGLRKLYVRGQMQAAVRDALRAVKASLERGGQLAVQYVADKESEKKGFNPAKQYKAQYQPPSQQATNDLLGAGVGSSTGGVAADDLL